MHESLSPRLSLAERDRRWARTRAFLAERGLDGLIVAGLKGRERFETYLADDLLDGIVVFPADGDPVHLTWAPTKITGRTDAVGRERTYWIDDIRAGTLTGTLVEVLREKRLDTSRVGVLGLESNLPGEPVGVIPYALWDAVLQGAPRAEFVDVWWDYALTMLPKSEEELELVRESAAIGEAACAAMLAATYAGARETDLYAAVMSTLYGRGSVTTAPNLLMRCGTEHFTISQPAWTFSGGAARVLQPGDVANAEIFSNYGGLETQQQMTIAVGEPDAVHAQLGEVARRCYEVGLAALRPGASFAAVDDAMQQVILEAGCWHIAPLVQTLNPIVLNGALCYGCEQVADAASFRGLAPVPRTGDAVLTEGMVIELEPNACRGPHRVTVGGTAIITADGVEELNDISNRLNHVAR